eukprot:tig00000219_g19469.t1
MDRPDHAAFVQAANALTQFYKTSVASQKTSYLKGYRSALESVSRWLAKEQQLGATASRTVSVDALSQLLVQEMRTALVEDADRDRDESDSGERPRAAQSPPSESTTDMSHRAAEEPRAASFGPVSASSNERERASASPMRAPNSSSLPFSSSAQSNASSSSSSSAPVHDPSARLGSPARGAFQLAAVASSQPRKRQLGHMFHAPDPVLGINFLDSNLDGLHLQEQFSKRGRLAAAGPFSGAGPS